MALPPKDRYCLTWLIFCLLGMGCLLPWSFFISVSDYWTYKFRNVSVTDHDQDSHNATNGVLTPLQIKWNSYLSIASMIPRVIFLLFNAAFGSPLREAIQTNFFSTVPSLSHSFFFG